MMEPSFVLASLYLVNKSSLGDSVLTLCIMGCTNSSELGGVRSSTMWQHEGQAKEHHMGVARRGFIFRLLVCLLKNGNQ
jgi:hypothetical protein